MDKQFLRNVIMPTLSLAWFIGIFFLGWWAILWTFIGIAIGLIIKQLKENV